VEISVFIVMVSILPNHSPTILCTSKIRNLSKQVGVPPGVGSDCGRFEILGGGSESA